MSIAIHNYSRPGKQTRTVYGDDHGKLYLDPNHTIEMKLHPHRKVTEWDVVIAIVISVALIAFIYWITPTK